MKDYLLISNTKENKISNFYLDLVSSHVQKSTNEEVKRPLLSKSNNDQEIRRRSLRLDDYDCNKINMIQNLKKSCLIFNLIMELIVIL